MADSMVMVPKGLSVITLPGAAIEASRSLKILRTLQRGLGIP